jgi:rare lipoprotein A
MKRIILMLGVMLSLSACSEIQLFSHVAKTANAPPPQQGTFKVGKPYNVEGRTYTPQEQYDLVETGIISWYGPGFHGKKTASGERFDENELTAAHRTLQMPSLVRVTNLENGKSLIVRVNDRGPFKRSRVMDVSKRAAELLGFKANGTAKAKLEVLPKESMRAAHAAKRGIDTSGYEVALNTRGSDTMYKEMPAWAQEGAVSQPPQQIIADGGAQPYDVASMTAPPPSQMSAVPASIEGEVLAPPPVQGHTNNGVFYPDQVVTQRAVMPTGIYVQAGSFAQRDNADRLREAMHDIGHAGVYQTSVRGQPYYRVRLGPFATVAEADSMLQRVVGAGQGSAKVVVE